MKVVNDGDNVFDGKTFDTHFVKESRYGKWKGQMEKNGYQRSNLRNGYWRNGAAASGQRYVKDRNGSRFRSQSGWAGFNRYRSKSGGNANGNRNGDRSGSRPLGQKSELVKYVEELVKENKEIRKEYQYIKKQLKEVIEKIER